MAGYVENFKSKLDWAMPFQRTGAFPLDRSSIFASYDDALEYAKQTGNDSRGLGGTSYVTQIVGVYSADEVAAYIITAIGENASLMKLAQTTASGDYAADIARLDGALSDLTTRVKALEDAGYGTLIEGLDSRTGDLETAIANVYTKTETDAAISKAVADADHLKRVVVSSLGEIVTEYKNDENYIYMLAKTDAEENNGFDEYMVLNGSIEKVGAWAIDLSGYLTSDAAAQTYATKDALKNTTDDVSALQETVGGHTTSIGTLEGKVKTLEDDFAALDVSDQITTEINKLDKIDSAVDGQYVSEVSEENGVITVKRAAFNFDEAGTAESKANTALTEAKSYADGLAENYDAAGTATTKAAEAESNAKKYADGLASNYEVAGAAATAETNAKSYADGLATNYDAAGSAETAETNAKSYTDEKVAAATLVWEELE
jgi:hypothetical protein